MDKVEVNGPRADPLFELAKRSFPGDVTWNFDGAFVFGADGAPLGRFSLRSADLSYAESLVRKAVATAR